MPINRDYHNCDPQLYTYLFNTDSGAKVLDDLRARFYEIQSHVRGDSHETAFNEGGRFVLGFILNRIETGKQDPNNLEAS